MSRLLYEVWLIESLKLMMAKIESNENNNNYCCRTLWSCPTEMRGWLDFWIFGFLDVCIVPHSIKGSVVAHGIWLVLPCGPWAHTLGRVLVGLGEQWLVSYIFFCFDCHVEYKFICLWKHSSGSWTFWWHVKRKTMCFYELICAVMLPSVLLAAFHSLSEIITNN